MLHVQVRVEGRVLVFFHRQQHVPSCEIVSCRTGRAITRSSRVIAKPIIGSVRWVMGFAKKAREERFFLLYPSYKSIHHETFVSTDCNGSAPVTRATTLRASARSVSARQATWPSGRTRTNWRW